jgi:hypothetical protein
MAYSAGDIDLKSRWFNREEYRGQSRILEGHKATLWLSVAEFGRHTSKSTFTEMRGHFSWWDDQTKYRVGNTPIQQADISEFVAGVNLRDWQTDIPFLRLGIRGDFHGLPFDSHGLEFKAPSNDSSRTPYSRVISKCLWNADQIPRPW